MPGMISSSVQRKIYQHGHSYGFPIGEVGKQRLKGRLFPSGQVQIEPGIAHFDNTAQNEIQDPQHDCR